MTKIITYLTDLYASYRLRIIVSALVAISFIGVYHAGKAIGAAEERSSSATSQVAATTKGVRDGETIEQGVITLSDDDLDRRYAKWLRD